MLYSTKMKMTRFRNMDKSKQTMKAGQHECSICKKQRDLYELSGDTPDSEAICAKCEIKNFRDTISDILDILKKDIINDHDSFSSRIMLGRMDDIRFEISMFEHKFRRSR